MKIGDLFDRSIHRSINGVIKADQADENSVWQELDEYVITRELDVHLRAFLKAYLAPETMSRSATASCRNGIWVSGFFGSGKSHFIKILSYLLGNQVAHTNGIERSALDFFKEKILGSEVPDSLFAADLEKATRIPADIILFNVDSKANSADDRAIFNVFLRVFNEKLGYCAEYPHIAHLERYLVQKGKYDAFKDAFRDAAGAHWVDQRDAYSFHAEEIGIALSSALGMSFKDADAWLTRFETEFRPTIENFAKWVAEYVDSKGPGHRIVFLADEIGAFIGSNTDRMLNLQTIVENLGTTCKGGAWVVVTSQADMDVILGDVQGSKKNDFSKIQGRFGARLSLSGSHADEVIQSRILAKTDRASAELRTVYAASGEILQHKVQFRDTGMTMRSYANEDDFVRNYPFLPYQFQLVQKIFDSSRVHGATGAHLAKGERSMLDAFQTAAQDVSDRNVGVLVPLHHFYGSIESFLEDVVRRAIKGVLKNPDLEAFDGLVLKTLFLIRYVDEMTGNLDNLVTLFLDEVDADRLALRHRLQASLNRLEIQTLVSRNGENYYFLTNEERDIGKEIKAIGLMPGEDTGLLGKTLYDEVLRIVDRGKFRFATTKSDFEVSRFIDGRPLPPVREDAVGLRIITPLADDYTEYHEAHAIMQSAGADGQVLLVLGDDPNLAREVREYLQVDKFATIKVDATQSDSVRRIIRHRQEENRGREERIRVTLEKLVSQARIYAAGKRLYVKGANASAVVTEALDYAIANTFKKLTYVKRLTEDPMKEIRALLANTDSTLDLKAGDPNQAALDEVLARVALMAQASKQIVFFDLVEHFAKRPYGWPQFETVLLLTKLFVAGEIDFNLNQEKLLREKVAGEIDGANKWRRITITKRRTLEAAALQKARMAAKDIFEKMAPDGVEALGAMIRESLGVWRTSIDSWQPLAATGKFPGKQAMADAKGVILTLLAYKDHIEIIEKFLDVKRDLEDVADSFSAVSGFYRNQQTAWEAMRSAILRFEVNEKELVRRDEAAAAMATIREILALEKPYGRIKDGAGLIAILDRHNDEILSARRVHAIGIIDPLISRVTAELEKVKADSSLRNRVLHPLQLLRNGIETQTSIAHLFQLQEDARDAADEAHNFIASEVEHRAREQEKKRPVLVAGGGRPLGDPDADPAPPAPPPKKIKVVRFADLGSLGGYIESVAEVDAFIERLRRTLTEAVAKNERISIR
ncbi:BREX system P-loop protein BrxC [Methylobacterium oxalidis]|uniref:BREX system P-loop protein BrxC n=1 Tax=Methylobacterium oxalidis TaxID=944322 RepID=UPI0033159A83